MAQDPDHKAILWHYLRIQRQVFLDKLEGLSEQQARTPLTGTGTNILGVFKHAVSVEGGYLGDCFGRPSPVEFPWFAEGAEDNADMWATADESRQSVVDLYGRVWQHTEATIAALDLDSPGVVPWWSPERKNVTLHTILVHMIAETNRHAGHADILRELIDGSVGHRAGLSNLPDLDAGTWAAHHDRLEETARLFR